MENTEKISELNKLLPHGSRIIIAKRAKTSQKSVTNFFEGTLKQVHIRQAILKEAVKYYKELKKQEDDILKSILG